MECGLPYVCFLGLQLPQGKPTPMPVPVPDIVRIWVVTVGQEQETVYQGWVVTLGQEQGTVYQGSPCSFPLEPIRQL